jgi:hypothetical protein
MEEKEIIVDGKKEKIIIKIPKEEYEENNSYRFLEDTIELNDILEEVKENDKE